MLVQPRGVDYHRAVQATRFALQTDGLSLVGPWLALLALVGMLFILLRQLGGTGRMKMLASAAIVLVAAAAGLTVLERRDLGVELRADELVVDGLVRARLDRSQVLGHRARIIDLDRQPSFEISRPLGAGLGWGQQSGWALLRNGMVVYALVGSGRRWLMVPTQDQFYLALAVQDLDGLKAHLESWSLATAPTAAQREQP